MDFSKPNDLVLFIVLVLFALTVLSFVIANMVNYVLGRVRNRRIAKRNENYLVYVVDLRKEVVTYFSLTKIAEKVDISLAEFYSRFTENNVDRIKDWFNKISSNSVSPFIEAELFREAKKAPLRILLRLMNYNERNGRIILQSEIINQNDKMSVRSHRSEKGAIVSRLDIMNEINSVKTLRGYTFAIRLSYFGAKIANNDYNEQYFYTIIKYTLTSFAHVAKTNRKLLEVNTNEFVLFDMQTSTNEDAVQIAITISNLIKKELKKEGSGKQFSFSIGIVQNGQYYHDFNHLIEKAEQVAIHAQQMETDYFLYDKTSNVTLQSEKYSEQLRNILSGGHLFITYRPIIDAYNNRVLGYFSYVNSHDLLFNNFNEMLKYASQYGQTREILDYIERQIIPVYSSSDRTNGASLFIEMSAYAFEDAVDVISQIQTVNNVDIVLQFDEHELFDNSSDVNELIGRLKKLSDAGFGLALAVNDKNLLLDPKINLEFDYFVVKASNIQKREKYNSITHSLNSIIASLQRYNKIIIVTDIPNRNYVDIVIQSGVNNVSSDSNGVSSVMVTPVSDKRMKELHDIAMNASRRI